MTNRILKGENISFKVIPYDKEYIAIVKDFDCGNSEINKYLVNDALDDADAKTYLVINTDTSDIIGFTSISCSGVHYTFDDTLQATIPAIEIKYFAITNELHKLVYDDTDEHFYFSDMVLCELLRIIRDISDNVIGARLVVLYSIDSAKQFYARNMFKPYEPFMLKNNTRYLNGCTPMYMPL